MTDAPPPRPAGAEPVPGYRLVGHLARGRTLDVHEAWCEDRGASCVLKLPRPELEDDRSVARRLTREGGLLLRLSHPHLVRAYAVAHEPAAVVLETVTGATVARLVEDGPRLTPEEVAHLGLHAGSALRYLHRSGWLHLDLKPANVIAEGARAKVIDLSLASRPRRVRAGTGTWCYMAPEQVTGGPVGPAADVWGLGALLYEAAGGRAPFDHPADEGTAGVLPAGATDPGTGSAADPHDRVPAPPLGRLRRLPRSLTELVEACLDPAPARRPVIDAVLAALERIAGLPATRRRFAG